MEQNRRILNLGSGNRKVTGINLDLNILTDPDVVADLEAFLPFKDNSFDEIDACHIIEHIHNPIRLLNEIQRVAKPWARFHLEVPHAENPMFWEDPSHVRPWMEGTLFAVCSRGADFGLTQNFVPENAWTMPMSETDKRKSVLVADLRVRK